MPVIRRVPQDYASIAAAHTAAESGDIIYITGRYTGAVTVTKAVHLVGAGGLTDQVFSSSTANGFGFTNSTAGIVTYNLSLEEAAKVPFLLLENLVLQNTNSNAPSTENSVVRLMGSPPASGLVISRCLLDKNGAPPVLGVKTAGWAVGLSRCTVIGSSNLGIYAVPLTSGYIDKCVIPFTLSTADQAQLWSLSDYVAASQAGYGTIGTDIVLRWENLDFEAYRIYGTVTDIPTFVTPAEFEIRLYAEKTAQGNDMGFSPLEVIPLSLIETVDNKWSGSWEFNYLLPTRRYGVLINPPDGMQGHWLRWYNPAVE